MSGSKAFLFYKGRYLFVLRDDIPTISSPNTWDIIGGGIEEGETPLEAAIREVQEEVNISVEPSQLKLIQEYDFVEELSGKTLHGTWYFAKLTDEQAAQAKLGNEGQEMRWMTLDEVKPLAKTKRLTQYLEKITPVLKQCEEKFSNHIL
jgi:8-oxo-dGTP diphosphatase